MNSIKYIYIIAVVSIIILSAIFRLGFLDSYRFASDEDSTSCEILNYVNWHRLPPLIGEAHGGMPSISVIGIWFYLVMCFFRDPRFVTLAAIAIPNTIAVILCFAYCYKFIDKRSAIISSALFGFSCWAIIYSKNLWGVNLCQLVSMLFFYILTLGVCKSKISAIIISILFLPFMSSFHQTGFTILISGALILLIYFVRFNLRILIITIAALSAAFLLLFFCTGGLYGKFSMLKSTIMFNFNGGGITAVFDLIVRGNWYYLFIYTAPKYPYIEECFNFFIRIIFMFGCIYIIKRSVQDLRQKRITAYFIIGSWFFIYIILFGFTNLTTHAHYFMLLLPSLFIIASIGFCSIIDYVSGKTRIEAWELLLLFLVLMLWSPLISILIFSILLFIRKLPKKITVYSFYSIISFILLFQAFSNFQLFVEIEKMGSVAGIARMDLGAKIKVAKYILKDAKGKFRQSAEKSYYTILNDNAYRYLFRYLMPEHEIFISDKEIKRGYHYIIVGNPEKYDDMGRLKNCLYHERIGPKLVIVERINET